ncbi:MAG: DUF2490 domain-containing protein [Bacteroidia bacterium]|nr:DUF2490 domain-containing protein [Bacteroidia bacterium]
MWLYLKFDKKISDKGTLNLTLQNRFHNNVAEFSQRFVDVGYEHKISKHLRFLADYVYGGKRRNDGSFNHVHQLYAGFLLRQKWKQFTFIYRNVVQASMENVYSSDNGQIPLFYERNKGTIKYSINKTLDFYVASELNSPFYRIQDLPVRRTRLFAGLEYQFTKRISFESYFMLQNRYRYSNPSSREFVYGLSFSYHF